MSVRRYESLNDIRKSFDLVNAIVNSVNQEVNDDEKVDFHPRVNTRETEETYYLEVELPGVAKENVEINVDANILRITGERNRRDEVKEEEYLKVESRYGLFLRSFTLPEKVAIEKIEAEFLNGILEISIPKLKVEESSTRIEIK